MKGLCLLGSTGEIGRRVLEVVRRIPGYRVHTLSARRNSRRLAEQVSEFTPRLAILMDPEALPDLKARLNGTPTRVELGRDALIDAVRSSEVDVVFCAIAGAQGLRVSVEALRAGKVLALANKESLVMGGRWLTDLARRNGAVILPVDSEHSAIFQVLQGRRPSEIRKLVVTGSGGPFRTTPAEALDRVTPEQALRHPIWPMGPKITIDSATLMNKALEILEATALFEVPPSAVEVLIHPQCVLHGLVEFRDGSVMAQMSEPDMHLPIQYALTYPEHTAPPAVRSLDLARMGSLTFEAPDRKRFPSVEFGYEAARRGGTAGTVLNGADEVAVSAFLRGRIGFRRIFDAVGHVLAAHQTLEQPTLEQILEADAWARREAARFLGIPLSEVGAD